VGNLTPIDFDKKRRGRPPKLKYLGWAVNEKHKDGRFVSKDCIWDESNEKVLVNKNIIIPKDGVPLLETNTFYLMTAKNNTKYPQWHIMAFDDGVLYSMLYFDIMTDRELLFKEFFDKVMNGEVTAFETLSFFVL